MIGWLRATARMARFIGVLGCAALDACWQRLSSGLDATPHHRAQWLQKWARRFLKCFNMRVTCKGAPPNAGMVASNHVSYLDILALADAMPCVFVSKSEVAGWPIIGMLTRVAGTLFLDRQRRRAAHELGDACVGVVKNGVPVCFFPEGTSTAGDRVLPFHSALFEPAVIHRWAVTPAAVRYRLPDGQIATWAAYWGDDTFVAHLWRLMHAPSLNAEVCFGAPLQGLESRRELSGAAHRAVCALAGFERKDVEFDGWGRESSRKYSVSGG